jgi:cellulose synthase/poly-beta-1,6-N-acetylglucosamine synthase-like glycosyltransferase
MATFAAGFLFVLMLVCVLYVFIMTLLVAGWLSLPKFITLKKELSTTVSIIIPARNEKENIEDCLRSISSQDVPSHLIEIIVIDDASEDGTVQAIQRAQQELPGLSIKLLKNDGAGKKSALLSGINASTGKLIITTDADTIHHKDWLRAIVSFYEEHKPSMIIAPLAYTREQSVFEKLQSLEVCGLVGAGAATAQLGMPVMCNGANLAFDRDAFHAAGGYGSSTLASGDDVMLMTRIHAHNPGSVRFIRAKKAMAYTRACSNINEFFQQRVRWAAKNRAAYNSASLGIGIIVFSMNLLLLAAFVISVFYRPLLMPSLILLGLKCVIDFLFLFLAAAFANKRGLLLFFVPAVLWNIFYVSITGLLSLQGKYSWKGRKQR